MVADLNGLLLKDCSVYTVHSLQILYMHLITMCSMQTYCTVLEYGIPLRNLCDLSISSVTNKLVLIPLPFHTHYLTGLEKCTIKQLHVALCIFAILEPPTDECYHCCNFSG